MSCQSGSEDLTKSLVFRLHEGTPEIVRDVLLERGWVEFNEEEQDENDWNLYWRSGFSNAEYENIMPWQRLIHYPKIMGITRKDNLARNLKRMSGVYGSTTYNFSPIAFILPNDYTKFVAEYTKDKKANGGKLGYWICKPVDLSRGRGIFIFQDIKDLTYSCSVIVQKYISNPLLISGYKFDLRIYVCVTSFCPLIVYIYQEGLVRFGTEKYSLASLDNVYAHLTNTSINRFGPSYTVDKERVGSGCKWTMSQFRAFLHSLNINEPLMWQRISNIVTMTLLTITPSIPSPPNCLELFGFDILIDENIKPWLLEVNYSPALMVDCNADVIVKKGLLYDLIDLLNYKEVDRLRQRGYPSPWQYNILSRSHPSFYVTNSFGNVLPLHSNASKKAKEIWSSTQNDSLLVYRKNCNQSNGYNQSEDQEMDSQKVEEENKSSYTSKQFSHMPRSTGEDSGKNIKKVYSSTGAVSVYCLDTKKCIKNVKPTRSLPKKTLTSQMREKMNRSYIRTQNPVGRVMLLGAKYEQSNGNFHKMGPRFPSVDLQRYKLASFPQYSLSEVDKKPKNRIGDFILTFPFNEITLKASRDPINIRIIMQELQKMPKILQQPKSAKSKSEPHLDGSSNRKECFGSFLWGPRNPPLLSECCFQN
ncbi:probable tubulin polyglutamylase TTLL2 [Chiloscyllium plagiosum]|uniref:probable tubulin polyglutamylase TTLL2 n=1 Tax=Chiloscyllium plagiosum TaxID=36176 RepID=UPI001CB7AF2D|nr:probable tubulin polyglutamylase TTLL2 [Chiloscyllium plagiosum]XP_043552210.1 probable tubulin polyglutamylase TTLL2 [Chiloscyllium plagiosum]